MQTIIADDIEEYCEAHTSDESDLLYRLYRETNLQTLRPRMLSGKLQGMFLTMISKMIAPRNILEIGTFTGYSSLCLAEGLVSDGFLHTIEMDVEYEDRIRNYFAQSELCNKICLHIGDANLIIPQLDIEWDLVFIDAQKKDYKHYYDLVFPHLKKGGFLLADNVLWSGKVIEEVRFNDKETQAILQFNDYVQQDNRVKNVLLPFRDGVLIVEKL